MTTTQRYKDDDATADFVILLSGYATLYVPEFRRKPFLIISQIMLTFELHPSR